MTQLLVQVTALLRNLAALSSNKQALVEGQCVQNLANLMDYHNSVFYDRYELMHNVARILW